MIIESLRTFHNYYGDQFTVECPSGSGNQATLAQVADILSLRLQSIFRTNDAGFRPVYGSQDPDRKQLSDPYWHDYFLFYEYFHGDSGIGLGASHQTGWTGLIANLIHEGAEKDV